MDLVNKPLKIIIFIKVNIKIITKMEKVKFYFLIRIIIKVIFKMDIFKVMDNIFINIKISYLKVNGNKVYNKDKVFYNLTMELLYKQIGKEDNHKK